jgi:hypothetical protein
MALTAADIRTLARRRIATLAEELVASGTLEGSAPEPEQVIAVADGLRRGRLFSLIEALAAQPLWQAVASPKLTRLHAQALIEQGKLEHARQLLEGLLASGERLEACGLLGRIEKQLYVNERQRAKRGDPEHLKRAVDAYLGAYEGDAGKPVWHGINAVAVLCRAVRDKVPHPRAADAPELARGILQRLEADFALDKTTAWDLATAAEANLALAEMELAELWLRRYANASDVEPFALASTMRQLEQVWGLNAEDLPGKHLLPPLKKALALLGREALVAPEFVQQADEGTLEKVFGGVFWSPQKLKLGLKRCEAVVRIERATGEGHGTGFAVPGSSLKPAWGDAWVLVTNAHVIAEGGHANALTPKQARATFHAVRDPQGRPFTTKLGDILASSPFTALDFSVVRLEQAPPGLEAYPLAENLPSLEGEKRLYVIGHPNGGDLMFSLQDNRLLDHGAPDDPRVHYRTPTEPGSSGSPVFDDGWELVALHHAGSATMKKIHGEGTYEANEGMWIQAVCRAC